MGPIAFSSCSNHSGPPSFTDRKYATHLSDITSYPGDTAVEGGSSFICISIYSEFSFSTVSTIDGLDDIPPP